MAKRGPKSKIDEKAIAAIYAVLTVGGSLADAADYVQIARDTLNRKLRSDPKFRKGVDHATAKGKVHLLNKIGRATAWQSAAWMLERKWPKEFGRKIDLTSDNKPINFTLKLGGLTGDKGDDE